MRHRHAEAQHDARTVSADEATRRTINTASNSEHSAAAGAQQHECNGVREAAMKHANNNDVERGANTLRRWHAELSNDEATRREEPSTLQRQ